MSIVMIISESTRTALECALRCDYGTRKTVIFLERDYKI